MLNSFATLLIALSMRAAWNSHQVKALHKGEQALIAESADDGKGYNLIVYLFCRRPYYVYIFMYISF